MSRTEVVSATPRAVCFSAGALCLQLSFSTSPFTKQTHWKQTVFYLRDTLTVCKDEVIRGRIKCTPNKNNPRDLDFELEYYFNGQHCESAAKLQYRMR